MLDMATKTELKRLREETKVVQEDVAMSAGVRVNTYRRAERGGNVSYTTAQNILKALNMFRGNRNLPLVERVEDLGLHIV